MTPPERPHASAIIDTATKKTTIFFLSARWRSLGDRELFTMPIPALGINASRSERPAITIRSASGQNSDSSMSMSLINSQPPGSEGQVLGLVRMLGLVRARRDALKRTGSLTTTLRPSAALRRLASLLLPFAFAAALAAAVRFHHGSASSPPLGPKGRLCGTHPLASSWTPRGPPRRDGTRPALPPRRVPSWSGADRPGR